MFVLLSVLSVSGFEVSNTLGSHMVLQRDRPVVVWGFAAAGVQVTASFAGDTKTATTDQGGVWRISLPATPAGGPYDIKVTSSEGSATLSDVLFGDVFLCGGQSNMQMTPTSGLDNGTAEINSADNYPTIRLFTVGQGTQSPNVPLTQLKSIEQGWTPSSKSSVGGPAWGTFSSVCWLFGRKLFDSLGKKVPLGLISNNWGGTAVQAWSSPDALKECKGSGASELYNAMIVPYTVGPMQFLGATWYQGEANVGAADYYACAQPAMIKDWRIKLGSPKMWFAFVHLAGYNYGEGPAPGDLRASQLAALALPLVGHSTAVDLGNAFDIHPQSKQLVGYRLTNSVLDQIYGIPAPWRCPIYKSATATTSGNRITVTIQFVDGTIGAGLTDQIPPSAAQVKADQCQGAGLNVTECGLPTIQIDDAARSTLTAKASLTADKKGLVFVVDAPNPGHKAISTSYGRASWAVTSFFNSDGLPVLGWFAPVGTTPTQLFPSGSSLSSSLPPAGPSMEWFARHQ